MHIPVSVVLPTLTTGGRGNDLNKDVVSMRAHACVEIAEL